ncbi:hypothetical protein EES39_40785 [Streptomyces sp. ADI92-24]|nr:hypothetical protein EES39_40785 [Streptomyces sp. ADI92-24]
MPLRVPGQVLGGGADGALGGVACLVVLEGAGAAVVRAAVDRGLLHTVGQARSGRGVGVGGGRVRAGGRGGVVGLLGAVAQGVVAVALPVGVGPANGCCRRTSGAVRLRGPCRGEPAQGIVLEALGVGGLLRVLAADRCHSGDVTGGVVGVRGVVHALGCDVPVGDLPGHAAGVLVVDLGLVDLLAQRGSVLESLGAGELVVGRVGDQDAESSADAEGQVVAVVVGGDAVGGNVPDSRVQRPEQSPGLGLVAVGPGVRTRQPSGRGGNRGGGGSGLVAVVEGPGLSGVGGAVHVTRATGELPLGQRVVDPLRQYGVALLDAGLASELVVLRGQGDIAVIGHRGDATGVVVRVVDLALVRVVDHGLLATAVEGVAPDVAVGVGDRLRLVVLPVRVRGLL